MSDLYYNLMAFFRNLRLFLKLAWNWRPWDASHSIDVFVTLLKAHAKDQLADKHHLYNVRRYRQCLRAAKQLEVAYDNYRYPAHTYLWKKYPFKKEVQPNGMQRWAHDYGEKINKMFNVARKKEDAIAKQRKIDAWLYIEKHIESFWS